MPAQPEQATDDGGPRPRVFVVDDDTNLRVMLARALATAGFEVESYSTGDEALDACRRACPDVLISDLVMPGLNGQQLATAIRRACGTAHLIFMSGFSANELRDLDITQVVFMPKPVSPAELIRTVQHLVEAGGGRS